MIAFRGLREHHLPEIRIFRKGLELFLNPRKLIGPRDLHIKVQGFSPATPDAASYRDSYRVKGPSCDRAANLLRRRKPRLKAAPIQRTRRDPACDRRLTPEIGRLHPAIVMGP